MASKTVSAQRRWNVRFETQNQIMINEDGDRIYRKLWKPDSVRQGGLPRAVVFFCHGFADHSDRQAPLANRLLKEDILVACHDHIGHGRSDGLRAHVDDFDIYVRDVLADVMELRRVYPGVPFLLAGQSMGGLIACLCLVEQEFDGCFLIAPAVVPDPATASPCLIRIVRCLGGCVPKMGIKKLESRYMTRSEEAQAAFNADPLTYHGKARVGWGVACLNAIDKLEGRAQEIKTPLLIQQGEDDKITNPDGAQFLANTVKGPVVYKTYSKMYHDLLHELPDATEIVLNDIAEWVNSVIDGHVTSQRSNAVQRTTTALEAAAAAETLPQNGDQSPAKAINGSNGQAGQAQTSNGHSGGEDGARSTHVEAADVKQPLLSPQRKSSTVLIANV
eukprot:TRINITY_DN12487_c1_g4_i2.p1 TRINITY_DN12487_c1_g4~~TRINITY_DN12487_c1_g4_i2.p1  ORF type:complete len:429 (+),score=81.32 TRINITY_DN12487_c1_g4_i2:118-1287(+)